MAPFWLALVVATTVGLGFASGAAAANGTQPNIIVIQTDDQDNGTVNQRVMPSVVNLLGSVGTTFDDYIDSGPLCCPSRAVMLTGQYGHNNGVMWNEPHPYADLRGKSNTLPVWLQRAGYVTAHLGKYLNNYGRFASDPNEVAPGWDEWHTALEGSRPVSYYDYTLQENGQSISYGSDGRDYITRVLNDKAENLIHRYVPGPRPLFLALDQIAPHVGPNQTRCHGAPLPYPRDLGKFEHTPLPESPAFNEADVSDKPRFVREKSRLTPEEIANLQRVNGCRLGALQAVDRGVAHIVDALGEEGALKDTAIFYTSDNGYLLGQHRETAKVVPYEKSLHVPLVVRVPPQFRGPGGAPPILPSTVANVDLAPTLLDLADAEPCPAQAQAPCRVLDGRSLLPAIQSDGQDWPQGRGILLELQGPRAAPNTPCDYRGVRTSDEVYIEYHGVVPPREGHGPCEPDNEVEHYDLLNDPFQLENIWPAAPGSPDAGRERLLSERVARLSDCAGVEGRDPEPESGHYCE